MGPSELAPILGRHFGNTIHLLLVLSHVIQNSNTH